jgi:hypothetical protein
MSQANAAAIRRRANVASNLPTPNPANNNVRPQTSKPSSDQTNISQSGLTLPQVIAVVDRRLINLETFMKESKEQKPATQNVQFSISEQANTQIPSFQSDIIDEYNHRFEILADEIANLKDIVLKLQTYTMDVNKMLVDERIQVFSDLGENQTNTHVESDSEVVVDNKQTTSMDLRNLVKEEFLSESD